MGLCVYRVIIASDILFVNSQKDDSCQILVGFHVNLAKSIKKDWNKANVPEGRAAALSPRGKTDYTAKKLYRPRTRMTPTITGSTQVI